MIWLKLIRWNNLFIILLTQLLLWICVLLPLRQWTNVSFVLDVFSFSLVCASTILIAAAGYIINDYFDIKIDAINRPEKVILEHKINRRAGLIYHFVLSFLGILLAGIVAYKAGKLQWLWVQFFSVILLFFYSSHFKRRFVIGNVVVALLTAFTILTLYIYEPALQSFFQKTPMLQNGDSLIPNPIWVLAIYTCFAFVLTWMREIVKDMEDHIGDAAEGCETMPIKWGLKRTSLFVQVLSLFALVPLLVASLKVQGFLRIYTFFALCIPLLVWVIYLPKYATVKHFGMMSHFLKWIMVLGIGSLIIYNFQANG